MTFVTGKINAQYYATTIQPASCNSCCDASFTIEITYCTNTTFDATSNSLTLTQTVGCCPFIFYYHNVCPGNYPFSTLQSELCVRVTQFVTIPFATGLIKNDGEKNTSSTIGVYPSPSHDILIIDFGNTPFKETVQLKLVSVLGQVAAPKFFDQVSRNSIDISDLPNGIYFLQIWNGQKLISNNKFVKD